LARIRAANKLRVRPDWEEISGTNSSVAYKHASIHPSDGRGRHEGSKEMEIYLCLYMHMSNYWAVQARQRPKMGRRRGSRGPRGRHPRGTWARAWAGRRPLRSTAACRLGGGEPAREGVKGARVGAVVALREAHEVGPGEVRVAARRGDGGRRAHHAVLARAQEEGQRPPLLPRVHHRAVEAALAPPVGKRLQKEPVSAVGRSERSIEIAMDSNWLNPMEWYVQ
jgi:hypothetical protein